MLCPPTVLILLISMLIIRRIVRLVGRLVSHLGVIAVFRAVIVVFYVELSQSEPDSAELDDVALAQVVSVELIWVQDVLGVFYDDPSHFDMDLVRVYFYGLIVEQPVASLLINQAHEVFNLWLIWILRIFLFGLLRSQSWQLHADILFLSLDVTASDKPVLDLRQVANIKIVETMTLSVPCLRCDQNPKIQY